MKVLILFAHPRPDRSEINIPMIQAAKKVDGVTVVDLYADYPSFDIDVAKEQQRLVDHDVVLFQHPFYWYSSPAILKEWQDLVLQHGWAYGHAGHALDGKVMASVITAGASQETYSADGIGHDLRALLLPFEKTAVLCRMRYLAPFALFRAGHAVSDGHLAGYVSDYHRYLKALVEGRLDLDAAEKASLINDGLDTLITSEGGA